MEHLLDAIINAVGLAVQTWLVVAVAATVCRKMKWAPLNITVNVIERPLDE